MDGDTIVVRLDGRDERVRYIGVDTPESVKPGAHVQCFAKTASHENERLVAGPGRSSSCATARRATATAGMLAYVYRASDGLFVNAELVQRRLRPHADDRRRTSRTRREFAAPGGRRRERRGRGLWNRCG